VAIGFMHAWAHPSHELQARRIVQSVLGEAVTVCVSSEVCPEMREYERFSTTAANAYVRPLMAGYLGRLRERVAQAGLVCPLLLMMSGGGLTTLALAERFPIRLVESGPAGGAILAAHLARECGLDEVLAFDMGGTTAKICLISHGVPARSRRFEVGRAWRNLKGSGLPIRIPVIELVEIGAGGGSIGRVDALLRITVGPDSCGAEPGPASYGRGGVLPAVTDANLVLGRLDPQRFAGGHLQLDQQRAEDALRRSVGDVLGLDAFWAAAGMSEIVEENMANAARVHAIERGKALEGATMIAFGGAAPLHAGRLAQKLGMRRVVIPTGAGVGSAIGFLRAPISFEVVRSDLALLRELPAVQVRERLRDMEAEALAIVAPAAGAAPLQVTRLAELRYAGQGHELQVSLPSTDLAQLAAADLADLAERFEQAYEQVYGLRIPGSAVEVVTWSVTVASQGAAVTTATQQPPSSTRQPSGSRQAWDPGQGQRQAFGLHWRFDLDPTEKIVGPALVAEHETTLVVPAGWSVQLNSNGHLVMEVMA
jgi:N-methylhydantoinase A